MIDPVATAHFGCLRAKPPGTGTFPEVDALLSAHMGFLALSESREICEDVVCVSLVSAAIVDAGSLCADIVCTAIDCEREMETKIATTDAAAICVAVESVEEVDL